MSLHRDSASLTLPISSEALRFAHAVSAPFAMNSMAQRVFGNAIAVATLHSFFEMLGVSSDYSDSALYSPAVQATVDISDLAVCGVGVLECRWIESDRPMISVPYESQGDRIGYAFVSCHLEQRQATIHGFLPDVDSEAVPLHSLRSVEYMLQHLDALSVPTTSLTRWLSGLFDVGWESFESLMGAPLKTAFRSAMLPCDASSTLASSHSGQVRRAKKIVWRSPDESTNRQPQPLPPVILAMEAIQVAPLSMRASVQLHPANGRLNLPLGIQLILVNDSSEPVMEASARSIDNYLELQCKGVPGEAFQVQIIQSNNSVVENFQF